MAVPTYVKVTIIKTVGFQLQITLGAAVKSSKLRGLRLLAILPVQTYRVSDAL